MKNILLPLLALFLLVQCGDPSNENTDTSSNASTTAANSSEAELAKSFCSCAEELIAINKKMESLHAEGKNDAFMEMSNQLGKTFRKTVNCAKRSLGDRSITEDETTKLANALITACPEIPEKMVDQLTMQVSK